MKNLITATILLSILNSFTYANDNQGTLLKCEKKCGEAPRLIDLPDPSDSDYESFLSRVQVFNTCIDKCGDPKRKRQSDKKVKKLDFQPSIEMINEELIACQTQLQIIQDKEPKVYDKLQRELKKIQESGISPKLEKGKAGSGAQK